MAFTGVTNAHGLSPQPTASRSPSWSLTTTTGRNQARFKPTMPKKSGVDGGANQVPTQHRLFDPRNFAIHFIMFFIRVNTQCNVRSRSFIMSEMAFLERQSSQPFLVCFFHQPTFLPSFLPSYLVSIEGEVIS